MIRIELPCYGIKIAMSNDRESASSISSDGLHEACPGCDQPYCEFDCDSSHVDDLESNAEVQNRIRFNMAIDALLGMVMAQAIAGLQVNNPAYIEGIETAIDGLMNNFNEANEKTIGLRAREKGNSVDVVVGHTACTMQEEFEKNAPDFTCPRPGCNSHTIEEVMLDGSTCSEVTSIDRESGELTYGNASNDGGYVDRYQCRGCGHIIIDDHSPHAEDGLDGHALVKALEELHA